MDAVLDAGTLKGHVNLRPILSKDLKRQINSVWIYPPAADRAVALAAADPLIPIV